MTQAELNSKSTIICKTILFCAINTALLKLSLFIVSKFPGLSNNFLSSSIGPILALLTTYIFVKFDKKSFSSIGVKFESSTLKRFFIGILLGIGVMSLYILCFVYSLGLKIQPNKNANLIFILLNALPIIILLAFMEEMIFRAYPLITLKNKIGQFAAVIITSILFGLYHLVFGWGISGFISTSIWGLAFGLLAIYSNGVSMPTGFHAAGNLMQLALGTTGSSYSIWNTVYKNGQQVKNFSNNVSTIIIAQLILLIFIILLMKWVFRKTNYL